MVSPGLDQMQAAQSQTSTAGSKAQHPSARVGFRQPRRAGTTAKAEASTSVNRIAKISIKQISVLLLFIGRQHRPR